jgi:hypothetical protein
MRPGAAPTDGATGVAADSSSTSGLNPAVIGGLAALVAAGVGAVVLLARRRGSDEDVE